MNKSVKALVISLLLIITLPMAKLSAQVSIWDGMINEKLERHPSPDLEPWDGVTINVPYSHDNTYYIYSPTELAWVAQQSISGDCFSGKTICLMNDIDLGGTNPIPSTWIPIKEFWGDFEGNGHVIQNLYHNNSGNDNVGLFGQVWYSTIQNLSLRGVNVTGNSYVGGFAGGISYSTITNCSVIGIIKGGCSVGGFCGYFGSYTNRPCSIHNCFSITDITATSDVGGFMGVVHAWTAETTISECFSSGLILSFTNNGHVGGLIGYVGVATNYENNNTNYGKLTISDCYSNCAIQGMSPSGFIGQMNSWNNNPENAGTVSVKNCYVTGSLNDGWAFIKKLDPESNNYLGCTNCFYDSQITGNCINEIVGVSPKSTVEMTPNIGFGLTGDDWVYTAGLYPQLSYFANNANPEIVKASQLSVSPIFLQNNDNSSVVHSSFQVSTANGVTWSSNAPDIIEINGVNATINLVMIDKTVELIATLNGISKKNHVTVAGSDTICIYQLSDLQFVAEQCNSGTTFEGKCIKLMNDITFPLNVPNNMISIGSYPNYPFKGTFDGNGKLITNLYIDQPNTPYQGFFGYTLNANLYNVGLVNITASGRNYTGGMVAYAVNTYMRDCYVNGGTLFALSYCGGLVGYQEQGTNSIISGCYNTCEVTGNNYVGGLIGFSNYSTVRNSYVAGRVSAQGEPVGAIIGGANEVLMYYCYFSTDITGQTNAIGWNNIGKDGGEGLTNAQMRDPQFVNTLNQNLTTPVWMADYATHINNGFPIIKWQRPGTGVEEHDAAKSCISLYPNPANGYVTIQSDDSNVSLQYVEVYDVMGRKVMSETLDGQSQEFSVDKLLSGVYHVRVQTSNGCYTHLKLVVE